MLQTLMVLVFVMKDGQEKTALYGKVLAQNRAKPVTLLPTALAASPMLNCQGQTVSVWMTMTVNLVKII